MEKLKQGCQWWFWRYGLLAAVILAGCGQGQQKDELDQFIDELRKSDPEAVKTLEKNKQAMSPKAPLPAGRGWGEMIRSYTNVAVEHEALYLEEPFEKQGSNDGYFRTWDGDSVLSLAASPAIFVGHVILLPAAMIAAPPWEAQTSRSIFPVVEPVYKLPGEASGMTRKEEISHE